MIYGHFRLRRHLMKADQHCQARDNAFRIWRAEFRMGEGTAQGVMLTAHRLGSCVVAVFTKEIAEDKSARATDRARSEGHPLTFTTEPEE